MNVETRTDPIVDGIAAAVWLQMLDEEEQRLMTSMAAVRSVDLGEASQDHGSLVLGPPDDGPAAASDVLEREVGFGLLEELDADLREVAAARRRVVAGTYGVCGACGDRVTTERLEALPATRWCVRCAEHQEHVRSGGPELA